MSADHDTIVNKLHEFINKILFLEKKMVIKFEELTLYPSEIHLILVMREQPTNATQMAQALHVTKGAVSQTISRLEKKGIIKKAKDPYLKNELTLTFTPLGKKVFKQFKLMQETMDNLWMDKIVPFDAKERAVIERFLDEMILVPDLLKKFKL